MTGNVVLSHHTEVDKDDFLTVITDEYLDNRDPERTYIWKVKVQRYKHSFTIVVAVDPRPDGFKYGHCIGLRYDPAYSTIGIDKSFNNKDTNFWYFGVPEVVFMGVLARFLSEKEQMDANYDR